MEIVAEEWRGVQGFTGFYEVSNLGSVRSLPRTVKCGRGVNHLKGMVLSPQLSGGYRAVVLCKGHYRISQMVHRLVAKEFVDGYSDELYVNHKNGLKEDNRAENLEWVTPRENSRHAIATGLNTMRGSFASPEGKIKCRMFHATRRRLSELQAESVRIRHAGGEKVASLAREFAMSEASIRDVVRGITYKPLDQIGR